MNRALFTAAFIGAGVGSLAAAAPPQNWKFDGSFSAYSGDYGTGEETDAHLFQSKFTRYFENVDAAVVIPFVNVTGRNSVIMTGATPVRGLRRRGRAGEESNGGLGDLVVSLHTIFWDEAGHRPNVGGTAFVKFPTADEDKGLGTGEFDEGARLELYKNFVGRNFGFLDLGATHVGDPPGVDYNDRWMVSLGGGRHFDRRFSASTYYTEERAVLAGEDNARDLTFAIDFGVCANGGLYSALLVGLSDGSPDTGLTFGGWLRY